MVDITFIINITFIGDGENNQRQQFKKNRSDHYLKFFDNDNCPNAAYFKSGKQMLNSVQDQEIDSTLNFANDLIG